MGFVFANPQGGTDFALTNIGLGARPSGLGGAYSALANDANAVFWNPAGALFGKQIQFNSMQVKLPSEANVYYLSSVFQSQDDQNRPQSAWGFFWLNGQVNELDWVTENAGADANKDIKPSDQFQYTSHVVGISYSGWLSTNVAYGLLASGYYQGFTKVANGQGFGFSLTPGVYWMLTPRLAVGSVIRDVLSAQKWDTGAHETFIPEWRLGASYAPINEWIISLEARQKIRPGYAPTAHAGTEYNFGLFRLRAGWDEDRFTAGCGMYAGPVDVQYAYVGDIAEGLGDNHRISLGVSF